MRNSTKTSATFTSINGTKISFSEVYKGIERMADYAVRNRIIREDEFNDVFQEAAIKMMTYIPSYNEKKSSPRTYGAMIARSCVYDCARTHNKGVVSLSSLIAEDWDANYMCQHLLASQMDETDCEMQRAQLSKSIDDAYEKLSPLNRQILDMIADGKKSGEIAKVIGKTPSATYTQLNRARTEFKGYLGGKAA